MGPCSAPWEGSPLPRACKIAAPRKDVGVEVRLVNCRDSKAMALCQRTPCFGRSATEKHRALSCLGRGGVPECIGGRPLEPVGAPPGLALLLPPPAPSASLRRSDSSGDVGCGSARRRVCLRTRPIFRRFSGRRAGGRVLSARSDHRCRR